MTMNNVKYLASATILQAVKDYFDKKSTPERRKVILKDLRSSWMDFFTNGVSLVAAEQLEKNPAEIKARLRKKV